MAYTGETDRDLNPKPGEGVVESHLPCVSCGYDLYRLPVEARCPECGAAVLTTIKDLLPNQPAAVLGTLCRGSTLLYRVVAMPLVLGLGSYLALLLAITLGREMIDPVLYAEVALGAIASAVGMV